LSATSRHSPVSAFRRATCVGLTAMARPTRRTHVGKGLTARAAASGSAKLAS
jgi:hypothetical protein